MIKCFVVKNIQEPMKGYFTVGEFYIAKISGNKSNMYSVLDKCQNWVSFSCYKSPGWNDLYSDYFTEWLTFQVNDKKELNDFIKSTDLY